VNFERKKILITGGAGFIGSHLIRHFIKKYPLYQIFNLDALSYAGNLENLDDIKESENYKFLHGNICDKSYINTIFNNFKFDAVIHLAAESHVDRSIKNPLGFANTNILGTIVLLNAFKSLWQGNWAGKRFYHLSTDEVYGTLGDNGLFKENTPYNPNSPYSASKASSDHFVRAYGQTYEMPYVISCCSNNYGPNQFPEKLIPLLINNILNNKTLPVYGEGLNIRDWIYVIDHIIAIDLIFHKGNNNETYNIGGYNEYKNIDLAKLICKKMDLKLGRELGTSEKLIKFTKDRPGHDLRYAIDATKIKKNLGWTPSFSFDDGICKTIDWYLKNKKWLDNVTTGDYRSYYAKNYKNQ
tara:strand:+ start:2045 stop:3109 length:1065 start_codon:yes stop_codon:yes gene_type:complete